MEETCSGTFNTAPGRKFRRRPSTLLGQRVGFAYLAPVAADLRFRSNVARPGGRTIRNLTSKQRAHLRSLAHDLKPILQVGRDGVTEAVLQSVMNAFNTRELMKVRVLDGAPEAVDEAAERIGEALMGVRVVYTMGRTVVLYRPFPEDPEIELPE